MGKTRTVLRFILEVVGMAGFIIVLVLLLWARPSGEQPVKQAETVSPPYPTITEAQVLPEKNPHPGEPYPLPGGTPPVPSPPARVQALLDKRSALGDVTAAVLDRGEMWLIQPDKPAQALTGFGDVAAIYGWNYDGSKLLFGRGQYETKGDLAKATELWAYDLDTGQAHRLVDSQQIWSASWSPVDDRVAYCEYGESPSISVVSLDGKIQQKRENLYDGFAWSPDGSAIAVNYVGPEMIEFDTKYSVIGLWWLEKDELQLLSEAKREAQYFPIWLTDGSHILFTRIFGPGSDGGESGLYIVDIRSKQMVPLQNGPKYIVNTIMRSPRSDSFVFWMGYDIYAMELGKEPIFIGKGSKPVWHPDGRAIFYDDESGFYGTEAFDFSVNDQFVGGYFSASTIHLQPDIFFKKDASQ